MTEYLLFAFGILLPKIPAFKNPRDSRGSLRGGHSIVSRSMKTQSIWGFYKCFQECGISYSIPILSPLSIFLSLVKTCGHGRASNSNRVLLPEESIEDTVRIRAQYRSPGPVKGALVLLRNHMAVIGLRG